LNIKKKITEIEKKRELEITPLKNIYELFDILNDIVERFNVNPDDIIIIEKDKKTFVRW